MGANITRRDLLSTALSLLLLLAFAGCQNVLQPGGKQEASRNEAQTKSTSQANRPAAAEQESAAAPTGSASDKGNLPQDQTLDLQVNHPNGTVLRVTKVSFNPDHITVDLVVTNGHKDTIKLNNSNDLVLRDNVGNRYNLSPPPQNPDIRIAPGSTLEGKVIFLGRIAPTATSLTLTTNDKYGNDGAEWATNPRMTIAGINVKRG